MANERYPSGRQEPDDESTDEWDDLLEDGDFEGALEDLDDAFDAPGTAPGPVVPAAGKEMPMPRQRESRREREVPRAGGDPSDAADFRPEEIEGAERTKDGLIRVKEGGRKKSGTASRKNKENMPWLKSLGTLDYIGLAASLAILIGLAGMLLSWMYGEEWGNGKDRPLPVAEVPAVGELFKLTSVESYWRRRADSDRAASSELILPEVIIEVEPVATSGFLSVFFQDPSGKMSADPGNLRMENGKIIVNANEGRELGPNRFIFTSTKGYSFEPEFRSYISVEGIKNWSIEIVETKEYGGADSKRLAYFEIARDARTREEPAKSE